MIWSPAKLSPDVRLLLDRERPIAVLPAAVRARAFARAHAALGAAEVATRPIPARGPSAVRWAAAAGLACMATVAAGAASYRLGVRERPTAQPASASTGTESSALHRSAGAEPVATNPLAARVLVEPPARFQAGTVRAELRLLEQARAAVAGEDFVLAMRLLNEHARRFRTGRLVEEREALRVKSLASLGRRSDARRAAADFEASFPRSPLLPTVSQMLDSAP